MKTVLPILKRAITSLGALAPGAVQPSLFVAPTSFNPATGQAPSLEVSAHVTAIVLALRPRELDLVHTQPGDEKVLLLAGELGAITPTLGHYLVQDATGQRRDVTAVDLDPSGSLWRLRVAKSLNEDFGDLTAATAADDWGDLASFTSSDDRGALL